MVTIRSYLNNVVSDSVSGTEKVFNRHLLHLLFIFIFYYIYFFLIALSQFFHHRKKFNSSLQRNLRSSGQCHMGPFLLVVVQHLPDLLTTK